MRRIDSILAIILVAAAAASCTDFPVADRYPPGTPPPSRPAPPSVPPTPQAQNEDHSAEPLAVSAELVHIRNQPFLNLHIGERQLIVPGRQPLHTATACTVIISAEQIAEGIVLHFDVSNQTDQPAATPDFHIAGINLPRHDVEILDNWKNVHFRGTLARNQNQLHALRSYPSDIYSPVMGIRTDDVFLGSSMIYSPLDQKKEVTLDYRYIPSESTWSMRYRLWDENNIANLRDGRTKPAVFAPGERMTFAIAVTVAEPSQWVTAFRPYRDFFRETYGNVRYQSNREPIYATSLGLSSRITPSNPRGYVVSGPTGSGRLDLIGWRGFHQHMLQELQPLGYRRFMLWHVSGSYKQHRNMNMVWEITSSWSPVMYETADELRQLQRSGFTVGFWWGRAFSISGGFDSGRRHAWDPGNDEDNAAAFRELDLAYEMGVRMIGLDATPRRIYSGELTPGSDVLYRQIFPMLYERYPQMHWVIEPAPCDYLHVWGSSFMWSGEVHGPTEFADYLVPGHESHAVMKRDRPLRGQDDRDSHMDTRLLDQYIQWGYTPIVFSAKRYELYLDESEDR